MKASLIWFAATVALVVAPAAKAQMTVDVAKITCRQYLFDRTFSPRAPMIANWLSGYFNGLKNNTVVDLGAMAKNKDKVEDYCRMNQDVTLIEAAKTALGLQKQSTIDQNCLAEAVELDGFCTTSSFTLTMPRSTIPRLSAADSDKSTTRP